MTVYKTIPDLPAATDATVNDQLEVSQSGTSRRLTVGQISALVGEAVSGSAGFGYSVASWGASQSASTAINTPAIISAVAAAAADSVPLYWPGGAGTYDTDFATPIPLFHTVKHIGEGILRRGSITFYPNPITVAQTNTIYVNATTGNDANDGLHTSVPKLTIQSAFDALANYGPALEGTWTIQMAAGSYAAATFPRNISSRAFITIRGPVVAHPGVPTVIIDKALSGAATWGLFARGGVLLQISYIKFLGTFNPAVYITDPGAYVYLTNVHVDGVNRSGTGLNFLGGVKYVVEGGRIENCDYGVNELFNISRDYAGAGSIAAGITIRNCNVGLHSKENCVGHFDYIHFEDNIIGLKLLQGCYGNIGNVTFVRNTLAIQTLNGAPHEYTGGIFGSGADVNGRRLDQKGHGVAPELFGWTGGTDSATQRVGARSLITLANDYVVQTHTGTLTDTVMWTATNVLTQDVFAVQGKRFELLVTGQVMTNPLVANATIRVYAGGTLIGVAVLPAATAASTQFIITTRCVCTADGDTQLVTTTLQGVTAATPVYLSATAAIMTDAAHSVSFRVQLGNVADTVRFYTKEVFG